MRRYIVFAGPVLGTQGGACDFLLDFSKLKDAENYRAQFLGLHRPRQYWSHVWDTKECLIIPNVHDEHGPVMADMLTGD